MSLLSYYHLLAFTLSDSPTIVEAQKESNKRGELERSPNKRREVAPVWGAQFLAVGFLVGFFGLPLEMPTEFSSFDGFFPFFWFLFLFLLFLRGLGKKRVGEGKLWHCGLEKRCGDESSKKVEL